MINSYYYCYISV